MKPTEDDLVEIEAEPAMHPGRVSPATSNQIQGSVTSISNTTQPQMMDSVFAPAMLNAFATVTTLMATGVLPGASGLQVPRSTTLNPAHVTIQCDYPEIEMFFQQLKEENPRRGVLLGSLPRDLTLQDFFCIDELEGKDEGFFIKAPYCLSQGNAQFVVTEIKKALDRVRRGGS